MPMDSYLFAKGMIQQAEEFGQYMDEHILSNWNPEMDQETKPGAHGDPGVAGVLPGRPHRRPADRPAPRRRRRHQAPPGAPAGRGASPLEGVRRAGGGAGGKRGPGGLQAPAPGHPDVQGNLHAGILADRDIPSDFRGDHSDPHLPEDGRGARRALGRRRPGRDARPRRDARPQWPADGRAARHDG